MEQTESTSLFGLSIDPNSKVHLAEAARWGKFLAIVGFIMCALIVVFGLFAATMMGTLMSAYGPGYGSASAGIGGFLTVLYIIIALVYFFPCLFLYRFATNTKLALASNDQDKLNYSFQNLKAMLRYMGIIMIIGLVLWGLVILAAIAGSAFR